MNPLAVGEQETELYVNGRIFTLDPTNEWADAMLVSEGKIQAVGEENQLRQQYTSARVIDLDTKFVMPALHDAHTHMLFSGLRMNFFAQIRPQATATEVIEDLMAFCESPESNLLPGGWIMGARVDPFTFGPNGLDKSLLDEAFPDRPVFLYQNAVHHGFANSAALAAAGVDESVKDPTGGRFVRSPAGKLTGALVEQATWPVLRSCPEFPDAIHDSALSWAVEACHRWGITSVQEASGSWQMLRSLKRLESAQRLDLNVHCHIVWREEAWGMASAESLDRLIERRAEFSSPHISTDCVKFWLDGSPMPPYRTSFSLGSDSEDLLIPAAEVLQAMESFDRQGIRMKIHCAGTGSVRYALDLLAEVRERNGGKETSHEIAHCNAVSAQDIDRFAKLNVIAEFSPTVWSDPAYAANFSEGYRFDAFHRAGAHITVGTDWGVTAEPNLFPGLAGMVNRGTESIDIKSAIRSVTTDGARAVGADHERGSLGPGKRADFIVLDRDLINCPPSEIGGTHVLRTVIEGRTVFEAADTLSGSGVAQNG